MQATYHKLKWSGGTKIAEEKREKQKPQMTSTTNQRRTKGLKKKEGCQSLGLSNVQGRGGGGCRMYHGILTRISHFSLDVRTSRLQAHIPVPCTSLSCPAHGKNDTLITTF